MSDNRLGYEKMCELYARYEKSEIYLVDFITEFEKICFNYIGGRNLGYFSDGFTRGCVSSLMVVFLRAMQGDEKAKSRLECDLELVDFNLEIVPMD